MAPKAHACMTHAYLKTATLKIMNQKRNWIFPTTPFYVYSHFNTICFEYFIIEECLQYLTLQVFCWKFQPWPAIHEHLINASELENGSWTYDSSH